MQMWLHGRIVVKLLAVSYDRGRRLETAGEQAASARLTLEVNHVALSSIQALRSFT